MRNVDVKYAKIIKILGCYCYVSNLETISVNDPNSIVFNLAKYFVKSFGDFIVSVLVNF